MEFKKGDTYTTKMLSRFDLDEKPLSPISILAHVEGFVIFRRDGHKLAIKTQSFIETYIEACEYKKTMCHIKLFQEGRGDFEYKGVYCDYTPHPKLEGNYEIHNGGDFIGRFDNWRECRKAIDTYLKNHTCVTL